MTTPTPSAGTESVVDPMEDAFGHRISYLRISITDRCNERCHYCIPEEDPTWLPREGILSFEEIHRVVRVGARLGVRKLRITGGEPLTRRGVVALLASLASIEGIDEVGISTNGTLLANTDPEGPRGETFAEGLAAAGVASANISLDSLDRERYAAASGRDYLERAIAGLRAARNAGLRVKINSVLMRNQSESELGALLDFAREEEALLRFIELMPVSDADVLKEDRFLSSGLARRILELRTGRLEERPDFRTNGPARYFEVPGTGGQLVGFISALSDLHFCDTCNKLRLTAEGKLRPCLGDHLEFDLRARLRTPGCTDADIARFLEEVVARKPEAHGFRNTYEPGRRMIAIGG